MTVEAPRTTPRQIETLAETTERFRSRARAVAALIGAAAAALLAGMVFTPFSSMISPGSVGWGLAAVAALIISTALLVVGSVVRADDLRSRTARVLRSVFAPWRMTAEVESTLAGTLEGVKGQALAIRKRVTSLMDAGMWFAAAGLVCVCVAVTTSLVEGASVSKYGLRFLDGNGAIAQCVHLGASFSGRISQSELRGDRPMIEIEIPADKCGSDKPVVVQVPRGSIAISQPAP